MYKRQLHNLIFNNTGLGIHLDASGEGNDLLAAPHLSLATSGGSCHTIAPRVTVVVSTGPPTTTVPSGVVGESVVQAVATLQQAGLGVSGVSGDPGKNVVGTQPSVGSTVPTGSSIQLFTH